MMKRFAGWLLVLGCLSVFGAEEPRKRLTADEIRIRDPFVLTDREQGRYILYASAGPTGVMAYVSRDLKQWEPPVRVLTLPAGLCSAVWAPEVHVYKGAYYLFTTLTQPAAEPKPVSMAEGWQSSRLCQRGTWIFRSDSPLGPFKPVKEGPVLPRSLMTLDGTLAVDQGKPYMVYCHEWIQMRDGTMEVVPLKEDLSDRAGEPVRLFAASEAAGAVQDPKRSFVTDGPFLYRSKNGSLLMIWSTFINNAYCVQVVKSATGRVTGPWTGHTPIYGKHGGHGMLFHALDGRLMLALHQPNSGAPERLKLFELEDTGDGLRMKDSPPVPGS